MGINEFVNNKTSKNNNILNLIGMLKNNSPEKAIEMILNNNPQAKQIIDMAKNNGNAKQMFFSMCNQRGINPNDILSLINGSNQ